MQENRFLIACSKRKLSFSLTIDSVIWRIFDGTTFFLSLLGKLVQKVQLKASNSNISVEQGLKRYDRKAFIEAVVFLDVTVFIYALCVVFVPAWELCAMVSTKLVRFEVAFTKFGTTAFFFLFKCTQILFTFPMLKMRNQSSKPSI